jgi:hypothetical protein
VGMDAVWCGGAHGAFIYDRARGEEVVRQGKQPVAVGCFTSPVSGRGGEEARE